MITKKCEHSYEPCSGGWLRVARKAEQSEYVSIPRQQSSLRTGSMPAAIESCWHGGSVLNKSNHLGEKSWWFSKIDIKFPHFEQCQQSQGSDTEDIHIANQSENILIQIPVDCILLRPYRFKSRVRCFTKFSFFRQRFWVSSVQVPCCAPSFSLLACLLASFSFKNLT